MWHHDPDKRNWWNFLNLAQETGSVFALLLLGFFRKQIHVGVWIDGFS